jgi:hypothetical protein
MHAGSWRHGSCKLLLRHAIMIAYFYYHAHKLAIISGSRFLKIRVESRFSFPMVDMAIDN